MTQSLITGVTYCSSMGGDSSGPEAKEQDQIEEIYAVG